MVFHGGVDGYSRSVVFLRIADNNRSSTVFAAFLDATLAYGVPSRVRSDHGGENVDVANFMLVHSGTGRGSMLTGASTHNQRVERFWRDLFTGCTQVFYNLFLSLEENNLLDLANDTHMFALHYVFLPLIQHRIDSFVEQYNNHPIRTEHNRTPRQLFISGAVNNYTTSTATRNGIFSRSGELGSTTHDTTTTSLTDHLAPTVEPPTVPCPLSTHQLHLLQARVHPVEHCQDLIGKDVYLRTVHETHALLQE